MRLGLGQDGSTLETSFTQLHCEFWYHFFFIIIFLTSFVIFSFENSSRTVSSLIQEGNNLKQFFSRSTSPVELQLCLFLFRYRSTSHPPLVGSVSFWRIRSFLSFVREPYKLLDFLLVVPVSNRGPSTYIYSNLYPKNQVSLANLKIKFTLPSGGFPTYVYSLH